MDTSQSADAAPQRNRLPVSWLTIAMFAIVLAYVDGFWATSVHDAVGAVDTNQAPFTKWLRDSTMMLPLFTLAVVGAVAVAHRWFGRHRRELVTVAAGGLLIVVATSVLSIAEVATNSAVDYRIQSNQLASSHSTHATIVAAAPATPTVVNPNSCNALCSARHATLRAHMRAIKYASIVVLITNFVVVLWLIAMRGGRLWRPRRSHGEELRVPTLAGAYPAGTSREIPVGVPSGV